MAETRSSSNGGGVYHFYDAEGNSGQMALATSRPMEKSSKSGFAREP